jgi:hypothetical protein
VVAYIHHPCLPSASGGLACLLGGIRWRALSVSLRVSAGLSALFMFSLECAVGDTQIFLCCDQMEAQLKKQGPESGPRKMIEQGGTPAKRQKTDQSSMQPGPVTERSSSLAQRTVMGSDDIVCHILTFLPAVDKSVADRCSLVSKGWYRSCQSSASWHSIRLGEGDDFIFFEEKARKSRLENLLPRLGRPMRALDFRNILKKDRHDDGAYDDLFHRIVIQCPELRVLLHSGSYDPRLRLASEKLNNLQHLWIDCTQSEVTNDELILTLAKVGRNLVTLKFEIFRWMMIPTAPDDIGILCPKLEAFSGGVKDQVLEGLCKTKNLKELRFIANRSFSKGLERLMQSIGHQMTSLEIDAGFWACDYVMLFRKLTLCSTLQRFILHTAHCIGGDQVSTEQFADFLSAAGQTLTEMQLHLCAEFTDEYLKLIAMHCPKLEQFAISDAEKSPTMGSYSCQAAQG